MALCQNQCSTCSVNYVCVPSVLLGVEAGTVVVTNKAFNAFLEEEHEVVRELTNSMNQWWWDRDKE